LCSGFIDAIPYPLNWCSLLSMTFILIYMTSSEQSDRVINTQNNIQSNTKFKFYVNSIR